MDKKLEKIVQALQKDFDASFEEFRGEAHVFVQPEQIVDVITALRDTHEFELLSALTAVDYWPQEEPRFHVIYQMTSITKNLSIQVRVPLAATSEVPTVSGVFHPLTGVSVNSGICSVSILMVTLIRVVF